ncbi:hypothetical protein N7917_24635 [Bacillus sp. OR9]|nr:hypothetical protein [Bacillus sp. OR9]
MNRKYKMSSVQKSLYVIDQMQESNITYNIPIMLEVEGKLIKNAYA